jgi:hypothetical protein
MVPCTTCPNINKCKIFYKWYKRHTNLYNNFVIKHVNKFPDKYSIGVILMATQRKKTPYVIIPSGNTFKAVKKNELEKMPPDELIKMAGQEYPISTRSVEVIVQVKLKEKDWSGKFKK